MNNVGIGDEIHRLLLRLFPICRSITGNGVRETLSIIRELIPGLLVHEVPTGTKCFDWSVPREWNVSAAYLIDPDGKKIVDFENNNLHVVGYSTPVDKELNLEELQNHLHSLPEQPDAIPYITSYYQERWGICLADSLRKELKPGRYRVKIDSELKEGNLTYGEIYLPGELKKEVLLSTYVCHPSMANNELSGPCVCTFLAKWLDQMPNRRYSYRIVFVPETIGAILYISRNLEHLKSHVVAGYIVTCIGDDRAYSYLPSRDGNTLSDRAALHALNSTDPNFHRYSFLERGSDERQYCSPGVDLPMATIMRSRYGTYPEYHTSLDNADFVTPSGLEGGFSVLQKALLAIERNRIPKATVLCEPQLGRRGLYPTLSTKGVSEQVLTMSNLLAYADGFSTLLEIADRIGSPFAEVDNVCRILETHGLISSVFD